MEPEKDTQWLKSPLTPAIKRVIADIVETAIHEYRKGESPSNDAITQRQAYKMFGEKWVKQCVRLGLAERKRGGTAKNSAVHYSKAELISVLAAQKANKSNIFTGTIRKTID
jgi:hypothetical protein